MKLTYRPEIDGLRAIAIIFIILSHFKELNFVSGGVNIFFVISGYLITQIFVKQNLDIKKFYKERFFKLYPELIFVSVTTFFLYLFIGDYYLWDLILRSFLTSVIAIFNFYLVKIGNIYGQENYINPFLPLWAFCVIIQFYIIFPIILKLTFIIKKKYNFQDTFIIKILFLIFLIFFLSNFLFKNELFNFYSPLSRYWQFFLGAFLFFLIKEKNKLYLNNITNYISVVLLCIWQLDFQFLNDWKVNQILLSLSTFLFLYSSVPNFVNKLLSFKFLIILGKISFPLYLIHMPIIYFVTTWFADDIFLISILIIIFIIFIYYNFLKLYVFNVILYFLKKKIIMIYIFIFIIFIFGSFVFDKRIIIAGEKKIYNFFSKINIISLFNEDFKKTYGNTWQETYQQLPGKDGGICFEREANNEFIKNCSFVKNQYYKNVFLVGGSELSSLGLDLNTRLKNFNYYHFAWGNFVYLPNFFIKNSNDKEVFLKRNDLIKNKISSLSNQTYILIGANFEYFYQNDLDFISQNNLNMKWEDGFRETIQDLSKNKLIKIILIYPIPNFKYDTHLKNSYKFNFKYKDDYFLSYQQFKKETQKGFKILDSIQGENIYRVYPHNLFCNSFIKDKCLSYYKNSIFFSDNHHPSIKGSEMINDLIMKEIEKIELKSN